MSATQRILHEQFLLCRKFTTDTFWAEIFTSAACNRWPRGMKYEPMKNILYVRYELTKGRPKSESFAVPEDVQARYDLLMHIFRNILNLKSDKDISASKQELEDIRKCSEVDLEVDWKKLKPRAMKNQILMNFAMTQINDHGLDYSDMKHLYNTIQLGFQFKSLSSDDVVYEKGLVTSIKGLEFNSETNTFIITNPQKSLARTDKPIVKTNRLFQSVDRWARDHKTYYTGVNN